MGGRRSRSVTDTDTPYDVCMLLKSFCKDGGELVATKISREPITIILSFSLPLTLHVLPVLKPEHPPSPSLKERFMRQDFNWILAF